MKSKISCFNKAIFKKNVTHFWPIWVLYMIYLIFALPVRMYERTSNMDYTDYLSAEAGKMMVAYRSISNAFSPSVTFIVAIIVAMAVFSYLHTGRSAHMMHALPLNRLELFVSNCLSGICFMIVPQIVVFVATVFIAAANGLANIEYLLVWLLANMALSFFAFSMAVLVNMLTGSIFAVPVYYGVANFLYVGITYLLATVTYYVCYGLTPFWDPKEWAILSPWYYIEESITFSAEYNNVTGEIDRIVFEGGSLLGVYAAVAVLLYVLSYLFYRKRHIEIVGDIISYRFLKPIFRWGVAFCLGASVACFFSELADEMSKQADTFVWVLLGAIVGGTVGFFGSQMFLEKSFRVFKIKRLLEAGTFLVLTVLVFGGVKMDVLGIEARIPDIAEVEKAYVNMDFPLEYIKEDAKVVLDLHEELLENKKVALAEKYDEELYHQTVYINYVLKDGERIRRRYPVAYTMDDIEDESTLIGKILSCEKDPDMLAKSLLGQNYEYNDYRSGYIELYNEQGDYSAYRFNEKELSDMVDAIMADIREGNLFWYEAYTVSQGAWESNEYYSAICLSFYNEKQYEDIYTNYNNSMEPEMEAAEMLSYGVKTTMEAGDCYLNFGPKCENILRVLEDYDIINEEQKLYTYNEYDELMDW